MNAFIRRIQYALQRQHAATQQGRIARWQGRHPYLVRSVGVFLVLVTTAFLYFYISFARMVEERLGHGNLRTISSIHAAPRVIAVGQQIPVQELVSRLQRAGYSDDQNNQVGHYRLLGNAIEISTGRDSYFQPHSVVVAFQGDRVAKITSRTENRDAPHYWLEPELITNVLDAGRSKRTPVAYGELPEHLVNAIVSVEDKRYFTHTGLDYIRVAKAAYVDIREGRKEQGASTITMQLARTYFLDQDKNWKRKISEVLLASELERRFNKEQIMELYANEVYLGRSGSFSVHGMGEASRAYFGKDVRQLTIPEAAMLAGLIQRPSYFNPFRYPERMKERRDLVLQMMHTNGYIDARQLTEATQTPIKLRPADTEPSDAPNFVDLINQDLQDRFGDYDFVKRNFRIYSTLDMDLQQAAMDAIEQNLPKVEKLAIAKLGKKVKGKPLQVALVALDPHTGAVKALVGGRNYRESQLNRALSMRPPGSTFKPFVYAAALNVGAQNGKVTAAYRVMDEPTTFRFNNEDYQPANYEDNYKGSVTMRTALINSLNIATIKYAEKVGYQPVVDIARAAGVSTQLQATPSLALGSYDVPPIEMAEAYTIFANEGVHVKRNYIASIRDSQNQPVYQQRPEKNPVLDERVAYIMTNMMEDVIQRGTAASARARGFKTPAAGKTGTAHDGWFVGYTSELLTAVWVGYDDYTELGLEGSKSALPVWTEFMKKAHTFKQYSDPKPFKAPEGLKKVTIDSTTGLLGGEYCSNLRQEFFVAGTEPKTRCGDHFDDSSMELVNYDMPRKTFVGRVLDIFR